MTTTKTILAAAVVGCCAGAVAALLWATNTARHPPTAAVIGPIQSTEPRPSAGAVPQPVGTSLRTPEPVAPPRPADAPTEDSPVLRARALAKEPDVQGIVAIRRDFLQDARRRGVENAADTTSRLAEIDRALNDARLLRLKRDGEQLRKMRPEAP
jgi:hypothetical protein